MQSLVLLANVYLGLSACRTLQSNWRRLIPGFDQNKIELGLVSCHDRPITFGWYFLDFMTRYVLRPITLHTFNFPSYVIYDILNQNSIIYILMDGFMSMFERFELMVFLLWVCLSDRYVHSYGDGGVDNLL